MILRIRSTLKEWHVNIILHVLFSLLNRHSLLNNMFKIQQHYIRCDTQIPVGCWDRKPFFKIPRKHKVSLWGPTRPSLFILILSCLAMPINLPMLQDSLSHNKQVATVPTVHMSRNQYDRTPRPVVQGCVQLFMSKILFVDCAIINLQRMITQGQQRGSSKSMLFLKFRLYSLNEQLKKHNTK